MAVPRPRPAPFWVLQVAELVLAVVLVDAAVHVARAGVLLTAAGAAAALALTARGPLGLLRVCSPRLHVRLCLVVAVLLLVALALPGLRPDAAGSLLTVVAMVGLVRLATLTRTEPGPPPRGSWPAAVVDARAVEGASPPPAQPATPPSAAPAPRPPGQHRADGGRAGDGASTDELARRAGRAVAAGKAAARRHRPAVEAGARRGLRSLGRAVGRMGR